MEPESDDDILLFEQPIIDCRQCHRVLPLTYGKLPQITLARVFDTESERQFLWPPDGWKVVFGCPECGRVDSYVSDDVYSQTGRLGEVAGYHDSATLFVATFPCGKLHCKAPST